MIPVFGPFMMMLRVLRLTILLLMGLSLFGLVFAATPGHADENSQSSVRLAIKDLGGSVRPISKQNPNAWEVEFHLTGRDLTDDGLAQLAKLDNVVSLNLRDTQVTGAGLIHLKEFNSLQILHLERTAVDDAGIAHLTGLKKLEYLNLYATEITDQCLEQIAELKSLRRLYVWRTKVTDEGVARLKKRLPELEIVQGLNLDNLPTFVEVEREEIEPEVDLRWMEVSNIGDVPKSEGGGANTQVVFVNATKQKLKLYWIDFGGERKLYGTLEPNGTRDQNSYARHRWLITDSKDQPLGYFLVGDQISRATVPADVIP